MRAPKRTRASGLVAGGVRAAPEGAVAAGGGSSAFSRRRGNRHGAVAVLVTVWGGAGGVQLWAAAQRGSEGAPPGEWLALGLYWCLSLVVTILIEGVVIGALLGLRAGPSMRLCGLLNLVSAVVGVPVGFLLGGTEHQLIPLAVSWGWRTLGVALNSVVVETVVGWLRVARESRVRLTGAVVLANAVSYALYLGLKLLR